MTGILQDSRSHHCRPAIGPEWVSHPQLRIERLLAEAVEGLQRPVELERERGLEGEVRSQVVSQEVHQVLEAVDHRRQAAKAARQAYQGEASQVGTQGGPSPAGVHLDVWALRQARKEVGLVLQTPSVHQIQRARSAQRRFLP